MYTFVNGTTGMRLDTNGLIPFFFGYTYSLWFMKKISGSLANKNFFYLNNIHGMASTVDKNKYAAGMQAISCNISIKCTKI